MKDNKILIEALKQIAWQCNSNTNHEISEIAFNAMVDYGNQDDESKWVILENVNSRPKNYQNVIALSNGEVFPCVYREFGFGSVYELWVLGDSGGKFDHDNGVVYATHWMQLPQPPIKD